MAFDRSRRKAKAGPATDPARKSGWGTTGTITFITTTPHSQRGAQTSMMTLLITTHHVDVLVAAVVAGLGEALRVLVGQHGAQALHHGAGREVLQRPGAGGGGADVEAGRELQPAQREQGSRSTISHLRRNQLQARQLAHALLLDEVVQLGVVVLQGRIAGQLHVWGGNTGVDGRITQNRSPRGVIIPPCRCPARLAGRHGAQALHGARCAPPPTASVARPQTHAPRHSRRPFRHHLLQQTFCEPNTEKMGQLNGLERRYSDEVAELSPVPTGGGFARRAPLPDTKAARGGCQF